MSDAAPSDEMSTAELTAKVMELHEKLTTQADERHRLNSAIQKTLLEYGNQVLGAGNAVTKLSADVQRVGMLVEKISERLLGNPAMHTVGLVTDVVALRKDVDSLKSDRLRIVTIVSTISALGALVAGLFSWLVSHWPFGKAP